MFGIAADERARQGDDFPTRGDQRAGRMALCRVRSFLFVDFVEHEILEVVSQVPLDERRGFIAAELTRHLPERAATTFNQPIGMFVVGFFAHFMVRQYPFALGAVFPQAGSRQSVPALLAGPVRVHVSHRPIDGLTADIARSHRPNALVVETPVATSFPAWPGHERCRLARPPFAAARRARPG